MSTRIFAQWCRCGWRECICSAHKPNHALKQCTRCRKVSYCNERCQRKYVSNAVADTHSYTDHILSIETGQIIGKSVVSIGVRILKGESMRIVECQLLGSTLEILLQTMSYR